MVKFFGDPLKEIKGAQSGKVIFRFDSKGEFITDDEAFISRALGHFDHAEIKVESIGERVKKTLIDPPLIITTNEKAEEKAEEKKIACEHCGQTFSDYLARGRHVKKEHGGA